jgi:hypothetical protein
MSGRQLADNSQTLSTKDIYKGVTEEKKKDIVDIYSVYELSVNLPKLRKVDRDLILALDKALDLYSADEIKSAIKDYDFVLGSSIHFFSYRWRFLDFIKRGLKNFVPEMKPRENLLNDRQKQGGSTGDPDEDKRPKPYVGRVSK